MAEVSVIEWKITPFRADRWLDIWEPVAARMPAFGAKSWSLIRSTENPLSFVQTAVWEDRADFERYWYSDVVAAAREEAIDLYDKPVLPVWHTLIAAG